jgi:hypothetical protein
MAHRFVMFLFLAGLAAGAGACGKEIGDDCQFHVDCSPNGDRICDFASEGGYCTIQGCDYATCPEEAVCVQFFAGGFSNKSCDPAATAEDCLIEDENPDPNLARRCCSLDELCAVDGQCVPRSSETRFCMRKCGGDGDCRDGYECRDLEKMIEHGGQPLLAPGVLVDDSAPRFCAAAVP